jgi:FKBP-type peptidyl-prolyl cis-trans isomerase FkpA
MKNITKFLMAFLCLGMIFASCSKSDGIDWAAEQEKQRLEMIRIDSTRKAQAPLLEQYAKTHFQNPVKSDSSGIWYEVLAVGQADSYDYKNGYPSISVNYTGQLTDQNGTIFSKSKEGTPANFSNLLLAIRQNFGVCWYYAFVPQTLNQNGQDAKLGGLLPKGLQKGSKIRFVSSSVFAYDNQEYKGTENVTVPKNSPVVYTIEVTDIAKATSN